MAFFYLDKYYKEWVELEMFCKDPITCAKKRIRDLYKERLPYFYASEWFECERIMKLIRRYQALIKRLQTGELMQFKLEEEGRVTYVSIEDFNYGKVDLKEE